jgi:hypothetical protein
MVCHQECAMSRPRASSGSQAAAGVVECSSRRGYPPATMISSRHVRPTVDASRGRHAIRRAGTAAVASRLGYAQVLVPRGLRRTRVSEMRAFRVGALARLAGRHPFRILERVPAGGPPV